MKPAASMSLHLFFRILGIALLLTLAYFGGQGVARISDGSAALSNVAPRQTHDMVMKYLEGDMAGSLAIQLAAIPVIDKLFCEVNPIPVKAALNQLGFQVGPLRMPLTEMEPEHQAQLKQAMIDFGIEVK